MNERQAEPTEDIPLRWRWLLDVTPEDLADGTPDFLPAYAAGGLYVTENIVSVSHFLNA